jgi:predicted kinase
MEAVILVGIQGTGKSTFYKERFFATHIRINLDMLKTRHREKLLVRACLDAKQPFVVDNTNVSAEQRARYIDVARAAGFKITGYYFSPEPHAALRRNQRRAGKERVPIAGVLATLKRLELPRPDEGFDDLYYVSIRDGGGFDVEAWKDEAQKPTDEGGAT